MNVPLKEWKVILLNEGHSPPRSIRIAFINKKFKEKSWGILIDCHTPRITLLSLSDIMKFRPF